MKLSKLLFFLFIITLFSCEDKYGKKRSGVTTLQLDSEWLFKSESEQTNRPATVPGCVHTDLFDNKVIDDPYFDNNELSLKWIENENWQYTTQFTLTQEELQNQHIELEFEGIDTKATVYLNGEIIISANNMFRTWKSEIQELSVEGENELKVFFDSPIEAYKPSVKQYPFKLPSGCEDEVINVSPFVRKAAYHFGWDWGPRFVTSGIWKPIRINMWNDCRISNVHCETVGMDEYGAEVEITVEIESGIADQYIEVIIDGESESIKLEKGSQSVLSTVWFEEDELWWPNGSGNPHLRDIEVILLKNSRIIDRNNTTFGARTIELINEPDEIGTSFYFAVNGQQVFIKGANYIPQSVFLSEVTYEDYETIVLEAVSANMNMLRVWGGGVYEQDVFYDLCDQYGIMVWQDFMFAGSMYPIDVDFANNVIEEVKDNVIRLRNHPCIATWCGNNEIEVGFNNWGWKEQYGWTDKFETELLNGYDDLFNKHIPDTLLKYSPNTNYTSTSPLSNWGKSDNFNHSTMHYWGVWHGKEPFAKFETNVPRFMVEYGFQSFPNFKTLESAISSQYMNLDNDIMLNRQKSYIGTNLITKHSEELFGESKGFADYIIKSQATQAEAYRIAIRAHRKNKGHCMGTMFWQFNDCWQGPSWSVLDYNKSRKLAFRVIQKYYQPMIALIDEKNDSIKVTVISDLLTKTQFNLRLFAVYKDKTIPIWNNKYAFPPNHKDILIYESFKKLGINKNSGIQAIKVELTSNYGDSFAEEIQL
ncbi:MAG: beta-mannosidase [Parvicellaceae bacterium]|jgi:beta-mannosidase